MGKPSQLTVSGNKWRQEEEKRHISGETTEDQACPSTALLGHYISASSWSTNNLKSKKYSRCGHGYSDGCKDPSHPLPWVAWRWHWQQAFVSLKKPQIFPAPSLCSPSKRQSSRLLCSLPQPRHSPPGPEGKGNTHSSPCLWVAIKAYFLPTRDPLLPKQRLERRHEAKPKQYCKVISLQLK